MMNGRLMRSVVLAFLLTACGFFAPDKSPTAKDSYTITAPSSQWQAITNPDSDYLFYGPQGSSLMLQSFCHEFQSESLSNLAQKTFRSLDKSTIVEQKEFMLQDRTALRSQGVATVDGVQVKLTLINTKRNNCYYDILEVLAHKEAPSIIDHFIQGINFK